MSSRIRVKLGEIELEYEGPEEFLKEQLPDFLTKVLELAQAVPLGVAPPVTPNRPVESRGHPAPAGQLSTSTIATKLGGGSGADLALAAATHLALQKGSLSFTRRDLLKAMQAAPTYYKATYSNNLTTYIDTLVKGDKLNAVGDNKFALSAKADQELRLKLGLA